MRAWHGGILRGADSFALCAACEKLREYQTCPYRSQVVYGSTPCWQTVQPDKDRGYFYKTFKQQQHHRKQPGGLNIHNP